MFVDKGKERTTDHEEDSRHDKASKTKRYLLICVALCLFVGLGFVFYNKIFNKETSLENPLHITEGYTHKNEDKGDGLTLLAVLEDEAKIGDQWFFLNDIFSFNDQKAIISYSIYDEFSIRNEEENPSSHDYLASYDFQTGILGDSRDITDQKDDFLYMDQKGLLWSWNTEEYGTSATGYDGSLNEVRKLIVPTDVWGQMSPDGEHFYFVSHGKLYRSDTNQDNGEREEVKLDTAFSPQLVYDIYQNEKKENYALLSGIAGDLKTYLAIANVDTGKVVYMNYEQKVSYLENGIFSVNKKNPEDMSENEPVTYADGNYEYAFPDDTSPYIKFIENNRILFVSLDQNSMESEHTIMNLWLYDQTTGKKLGSAQLTSNLKNAYILKAMTYSHEDTLLLYLTTEAGESLNTSAEFYRWDYGKGNRQFNDPTITKQKSTNGLLGKIDKKWDPSTFTPEKCPSKFTDLRKKADQLEEKYGIQIKISEECKDILNNDYAVTSVSDRDKISSALSALEYELDKYPDHFFDQLMWNEIQGIDIYLSGSLIGMNENVLDVGGGVTTIKGNRLVLAVNCTDSQEMRGILHHEIAHAIDRKLQHDEEHNKLDEKKWEELNPSNDLYSYSYKNYMNRDYEGEGLFDYIYNIGKKENTYFIDIYGLTYPGEDRAQIFEFAMVDGNDNIWKQYSHLKKKLDFYIQCIRQGFDTKDWNKVYWEKE